MGEPDQRYEDLYTADELRWRDRAREFATDRLEPIRAEIDEGGRCRELMRELGAAGLLGTTIPSALGGRELSQVHNALISEELSAVAPSLAAMRGVSDVFVGIPLKWFATAEQQQRWLRPMTDGSASYSLGITEPSAGSDAAGIETRAREQGDVYVIDGGKHYISGSMENDAILTYACTDPDAPPRQRFSAFMIPTTANGVSIAPIPTTGLRGFSHARVVFEDVVIPDDHMIGERGQGLDVLLAGLPPERIDIASRAVGCATRAYRESVEHARSRVQFGQTISRFQAVSHLIADMATWLEAARLMVTRSARLFDEGRNVDRESAICKLFATERAFRICDDAMQILAARGYTIGSPVDLMFRDVRALRFGGGTDEIMRHVIQREVFSEAGRAS